MAGKVPMNVDDLGIDLASISGHKVGGVGWDGVRENLGRDNQCSGIYIEYILLQITCHAILSYCNCIACVGPSYSFHLPLYLVFLILH